MAGFGVFLGILVVLAVLGVVGGRDSRDGEDWVRHLGSPRSAV